MTGQRHVVCPFCGRDYGVPLETTVITGNFVRTYTPDCVECNCGATWAINVWGGRPRHEQDGN